MQYGVTGRTLRRSILMSTIIDNISCRLGSYRDEPKISRTELSSAGNLWFCAYQDVVVTRLSKKLKT